MDLNRAVLLNSLTIIVLALSLIVHEITFDRFASRTEQQVGAQSR